MNEPTNPSRQDATMNHNSQDATENHTSLQLHPLHHARPLFPISTAALIDEMQEEILNLRRKLRHLTGENDAIREAHSLALAQFQTITYLDEVRKENERFWEVEWENSMLKEQLEKVFREGRKGVVGMGKELKEVKGMLAAKEEVVKEGVRKVGKLEGDVRALVKEVKRLRREVKGRSGEEGGMLGK